MIHDAASCRTPRPALAGMLARLITLSLGLAPAGVRAQTQPAAARSAATAFEVTEAGIPAILEALANGRVTSAQLVDAYLARMAAYDTAGPALNALLWINPGARTEAAYLDRERTAGRLHGPLHGVPVVIKDNFDLQGAPTTAGSVALAGNIAIADAFQVRRLKEAGAIILGKTNLHELASGITTISSLGGQTRNPYDPARNPGGSSGGTAAAVAASFAALGYGTDTCGSIRIPASQNSLFGLRPTKGLSSVAGVVPLSHTQDVAGPLARTVTDLAIGLDVTVGYDAQDSATRAVQQRTMPHFADSLRADALRGARLGVLEPLFGDTPDDQPMQRVVRAAIDEMQKQGAEVVSVQIAGLDSLLQGSGVIDHEFKFDLADYLAHSPAAFVHSLDDILRAGLYHASLEERLRRRNAAAARETDAYRAALAQRAALQRTVMAALDAQQLDALVYPTMRREPALLNEPQNGSTCALSAQTGFPALTAPAGFNGNGLPVGIELLGRPFSDAHLVALAYAFEQATHHRRPPATTPALVDGHAPPPITLSARTGTNTLPGQPPAALEAKFTFDPLHARLAWDFTITGLEADRVRAVALFRVAPGETVGPVIARLSHGGELHATGSLILAASDREALLDKRLQVAAFTRDDPAASARAVLLVQRRP